MANQVFSKVAILVRPEVSVEGLRRAVGKTIEAIEVRQAQHHQSKPQRPVTVVLRFTDGFSLAFTIRLGKTDLIRALERLDPRERPVELVMRWNGSTDFLMTWRD